METRSICGVRLYYDSKEEDTVELLSVACEKSILAITETWQLPVAGDCRVYLMGPTAPSSPRVSRRGG